MCTANPLPKLIRNLFLICCTFPLFKEVSGQNAVYPNNGTLYNNQLHTIHLLMHPDSLLDLLHPDNRWTNHSYPATFIYDQQDTLYQIGIRLKGNTSRNAHKQSFRLDIDEFSNQTYQGLKTFNLNGNHNDPSLSREVLSADVMGNAGIVSLRAAHVKLYINGVYRGVFSNAEYINKKFLSSRFGENSGNLYKCSWPADLGWLGNSQQSYKEVINPSPLNERAYELKTNESADDYGDLVTLINTINNTPANQFKSAIDTIFDVDAYLKVLAAEVLIGHWDNYFFNKNNYYLYHHQGSRKFIYLPYDMDNTFGIQWGVGNIDTRDVNNWGNLSGSAAPLTHRILSISEYKSRFHYYLKILCDDAFLQQRLFAKADSIKQYLAPAIAVDSFYTGKWTSDYGYTVNDWNNSYTQSLGGHAAIAIKPYIQNRRNSALTQIPVNTALAEMEMALTQPYFSSETNTLHISPNQLTQVSVISTNGQLVHEQQITPQQLRVPLENLPKGIYLAAFKTQERVHYLKFVVTR